MNILVINLNLNLNIYRHERFTTFLPAFLCLGLDASIDFNRWNEADEDELENTLSNSSSSPFSALNSGSQPSTTPFSNLGGSSSGLANQSGQAPPRTPAAGPFTTSVASQFIQLPARMTSSSGLILSASALSSNSLVPSTSQMSSSSLVLSTSPLSGNSLAPSSSPLSSGNLVLSTSSLSSSGSSISSSSLILSSSPLSSSGLVLSSGPLAGGGPLTNQQASQFLSEPVSKSWQPQSGLLNPTASNLADSPSLNSVGLSSMSSSPLNDVLSSLPSQNLGVQNLTLPSTTLDLSDIKWGILDPTVTIKRSGSTDSPVQGEERLTIQEDL